MMQSREDLGYKQPPPVRISIRRANNSYITMENESVASNNRPSMFDQLGKPTAKAFIFERLGPLKMNNKKFHRSYQSMKVSALPKA
ncbi:hypothetical protein RND71_013844 [Anisodus tanguticus]|uniref:Uncharacterized protein n=1 Tax=Anisodus tanguticus TaxID=243964 RepID=A0AAE1VM48_9SOLA|nr:hypothetical protein RND71_013844 [Anisodus tanguticus]